MTGHLVGVLVVGWLCLGGSLAGVYSASAQPTLSQITAVTPGSASPTSNATQSQLTERCQADRHCSLLATDATGLDGPAPFLAAVTNDDVNTIVMTAPHYVLKASAWAQYQNNPYVLKRNLTVLSAGRFPASTICSTCCWLNIGSADIFKLIHLYSV